MHDFFTQMGFVLLTTGLKCEPKQINVNLSDVPFRAGRRGGQTITREIQDTRKTVIHSIT